MLGRKMHLEKHTAVAASADAYGFVVVAEFPHLYVGPVVWTHAGMGRFDEVM